VFDDKNRKSTKNSLRGNDGAVEGTKGKTNCDLEGVENHGRMTSRSRKATRREGNTGMRVREKGQAS